ncbi:LytR C-terminal domain-containing protein [Nocardioides sp.]|uniref:LytR C-terminal domain-containing protein n=1 Tax=Nocardioides sp. TaxID=35761 RepID=UPI003565C3D6
MPGSRDQRGVVMPSPVLILSTVAVLMAGIAFVATRDAPTTEREITTIAQPAPTLSPLPQATPKPPKAPVIKRSKVAVEIYNNSGVTGLAGRVAGQASKVGWQVVGTDNWYGSVDANTVYYPKRLQAEAKQLALDLGIRRTAAAIDPMRFDRLTVILTQPLSR